MPLLTKPKKFKSPLYAKERIGNILGNTQSINKNECKYSTKKSCKKKPIDQMDKDSSCGPVVSKTELSKHMNNPSVKEAYASFLNKLSQASSSKGDQNSSSTPWNDLVTQSSLTETIKELEVDQINTSLSQDILNRKDAKDAYKKHNKDKLVIDEFDFTKNFRKTDKRIKKTITSETVHVENHENKKKKQKKRLTPENTQIRKELSIYEKMILIQESRNVGLYVLCDSCDKARYLPHVQDPLDLPEKWFCHMNPDKRNNNCSNPQDMIEDEEFLIKNLYNAGSVVWGRVEGYPWWPALVEDDPDIENYFWLEENIEEPTYYHVTFFDSDKVTRAWLRPHAIVPFKKNIKNAVYLPSKNSKYYKRIKFGMEQALIATDLPLIDRLKEYSFIKRYEKPLKEWKMLKKSSKKRNIIKNDGNDDEIGNFREKIIQKKKNKKENNNCSKKKFKRICTISTVSSNDNISLILGDMHWENLVNSDLDFLDI